MESLRGILAFTRAAQLRSFVAAGELLSLSASAVGKSVARLEERLGVRLINRTTRRLSLTEEGAAFLEHCLRILGELEEAEETLARGRAEARGRLRVAMPATFARLQVLPALPDFLDRHPNLEVEAVLGERWVDPVEEGMDVVVRIGPVPVSRLIARRVGWQRLVSCASPAYLARRGVPATPEALGEHDCLGYSDASGGRRHRWRFAVDGREMAMPVNGRLSFNDSEALVQAAVAGLGVVQVPEYVARDALADGRLQAVLGEFLALGEPISVVWPGNRHLSPRVRAFVDLLVAQEGNGVVGIRP